MATTYHADIQKLYVAYFNRPADVAGLNYWETVVEAANGNTAAVSAAFAASAEYKAAYGNMSFQNVVSAIYQNLFSRTPELAGLNYWTQELMAGRVTIDAAVTQIAAGAQNADKTAYDNKVLAATAFTNALNTAEEVLAYSGDAVSAAAKAFIGGITTDASLAAALVPATLDASVAAVLASGGASGSMVMTDGIDNLTGTTGDNVFSAPVVQNQNGSVTNSFETGDTITGGAGTDTLNAVLTGSQSINDDSSAPAISATTTGVEIINIRGQFSNNDNGAVVGNGSHVDAELMTGVTQFWSDNSRSSIQIEDVRILPEDLAFGMRQTDPSVSYEVYFDPAQLAEGRGTAGDSSLTMTLNDLANPADELENFPVDGLSFDLGGVTYTVRSDAMGASDTYDQFIAALNIALDANPALAGIVVTKNANNTITLTDPAGATFVARSYTFIDNAVPANGNLQFAQTVGAAVISDEPITTTVVLDAVGRTSQGGSLNLGSMADGGIAVFDVSVDRSSWLTSMASSEDFGGGDQHLETVTLTSIGANGNLAVGNRTAFLDGRVENGLTDVREVLNEGFAGTLNLGITLTDDSIERYLNEATGEVLFNYEGGAGNDNFNIVTSANLTVDTDFAMDVDMGAGDDRLNIDVTTANNVSVDGGTGTNTIAVSRSHGTTTANTFEGFAGFQTYEVEGNTATSHDFIATGGNMAGVTRLNVATTGGVATTFIDAPAVADVFITGKNQTLGNNSNADQAFGVITLRGTESTATDTELTVTLQNTARIDGVMTVGGIVLNDVSGTNVSGVATLNVVSAGVRSTSNVVTNIAAERVSTFNLTGTQALTTEVSAGANSSAGGAATTSLVITGATLTGDLDLTTDGAWITSVDNAAGAVVTLTGTAGDADRLTLDNAMDITVDTTVSAFETVRFLTASGDVVITNFSGVDLYDIESTTAAFTLDGMEGTEVVQVNTDLASVEANTLRFIADDQDSGSVLDLSFVDADTDTDEAVNTFAEIFAQDFREVSLGLGGEGTVNEAYTFDLNLVDEDGNDDAGNPAAYSPEDVYTRQVTVTGGGDQGAAGSAGGVDSVDLGTLTTVLSQIDLSGFTGTTALTLSVFTDAVLDRNTTITMNGYGSAITEADVGLDGHITTYEFTTDAVEDTEDVVITGFDAFNTAGNDLTNLSILDLSDLGIEGLADLTLVQNGGDIEITSNDGMNFEIVLVGVLLADLSNENFKFAA